MVAFGKSPYNSVLMHGWALTRRARRCPRATGPPSTLWDRQPLGADSLRLYLLKTNAPWEDIVFQGEGVKAANRTLNILWNVYKFAALYMSIDKFDPASVKLDALRDSLRAEDRWMMSKIESLKRDVTAAMEVYEIHKAVRAIEEFVVDDLSRWYVKLVRDRLWKEGEDKDKTVAFKVLHEALSTSVTLLSPVAPYVTEAIHSNLNGRPESVHMMTWPSHDSKWIDTNLEEGMKLVRAISEIGARVRQEADINLRWPLKRIVIKARTRTHPSRWCSSRSRPAAQNNIKDLQMVPMGRGMGRDAPQRRPEPERDRKGLQAVVQQDRSPAEEPASEVHQGGHRQRRVLPGHRGPAREDPAEHGLFYFDSAPGRGQL